MSAHDAHGTRYRFWGGPDDGTMIEASPEARWHQPDEWWLVEHDGYRIGGLVRHRNDNSICAVAYVWREVWDR